MAILVFHPSTLWADFWQVEHASPAALSKPPGKQSGGVGLSGGGSQAHDSRSSAVPAPPMLWRSSAMPKDKLNSAKGMATPSKEKHWFASILSSGKKKGSNTQVRSIMQVRRRTSNGVRLVCLLLPLCLTCSLAPSRSETCNAVHKLLAFPLQVKSFNCIHAAAGCR
jgi:hypothetical protein